LQQRRLPVRASGSPSIVEAALSTTDSKAFRASLRPLLRAHVAFDADCVNTSDPVTRAMIAHELRISIHTAKDHVKAVLAKTDTESRADLARLLSQGA
jgi:hypothetical protein